MLAKLKPLADVIDLQDAGEVKKLAAIVPYVKGKAGGMYPFLSVVVHTMNVVSLMCL